MNQNIGKVIQIIGPVLDIKFENGHLPDLLNAIEIEHEGKKVVCVVSGGNIDVNILDRVIKRGLLTSGRSALLKIELLDKPGQFVQISSIIAELGANIIGVHHERTNANTSITGCFIRITLETRNFEHLEQIKKAIRDAGFKMWD